MLKHHLTLHNNIEEIPQLADFVDVVCEEAGTDASLAMSINLALEEAVTNSMLYGYPEGTAGLVEIEGGDDGSMLTFIVSDSGVPFDPTQQAEADVTLGVEDRPIGGLGIFLVREIMDEVRYERQGDRNVLTLSKQLKK
jgi:anti-sigma regulatory factor (Ser/Thr protein kinase)